MKNEIPAFLRALLHEQYGKDVAERIEAGYGCVRPTTLRVNTLKTDVRAVKEYFDRAGITYSEVGWYGDALVVKNVREAELRKTQLYEKGEIYLQSLSSMLPPLLLAPAEGENILDMTAAPGGKTTQMSALSGGKAQITACERDKIRAERLRFNLLRQGAPRVNVLETDASRLDDFFRFDKILLDAPCSGSGTIEPCSPVRISEKLVANCVKMQTALLRKALKILKKGSFMVYSTCSVLRRENEDVLFRALEECGAEIVPVDKDGFSGVPFLPSAEGTLCVCPNELYEGFFLAKIEKKG